MEAKDRKVWKKRHAWEIARGLGNDGDKASSDWTPCLNFSLVFIFYFSYWFTKHHSNRWKEVLGSSASFSGAEAPCPEFKDKGIQDSSVGPDSRRWWCQDEGEGLRELPFVRSDRDKEKGLMVCGHLTHAGTRGSEKEGSSLADGQTKEGGELSRSW